MKTIIAGSRKFEDYDLFFSLLKSSTKAKDTLLKTNELVSGGARGIDTLGILYGRSINLKVRVFHAQWGTHGRAAGPIRNKQMADYADALIAFWDGKSRGTKNMILEMFKRRKPFHIIRLDR